MSNPWPAPGLGPIPMRLRTIEDIDFSLHSSVAIQVSFRMSYDMALYHRGFLKRAVETRMGDWTGADPISDDIIQAVFKTAEAAGFVRSPLDQAFIDFAKQEGFE